MSIRNIKIILSQTMMAFPQIQEVDLNPVRVFPGSKGILTLDARIRVGEGNHNAWRD